MTAGDTAPDDADLAEGLRTRIGQVVARFSQADVARKTGTSAMNVGRYVRGTKMPAEFCAALTRHMGVNPIWLLTGEGGMQLTDVTTATAQTATNLLELVDAMNAAMRVSVGALAGNDQQIALRKLNDSLIAYRRIRKELNEKAKPLLGKLLDDHARLKRQLTDREGQKRLLSAAEQTLMLCDDPKLVTRFKHLSATFAIDAGAPADAVRMLGEVFRDLFVSRGEIDNAALGSTVNYAVALRETNRFEEALAVCRAMRDLCGGRGPFEPQYYLAVIEGACEAELCQLQPGLARMIANIPKMQPTHQRTNRVFLQGALLLSGSSSVAEVLAADKVLFETWPERTRAMHANAMASHIVLLGAAEEVGLAARIYGLGSQQFEGAGWPFATIFLQKIAELNAARAVASNAANGTAASKNTTRVRRAHEQTSAPNWRVALKDTQYLAWREAKEPHKNFTAAVYACRLRWEGGDLKGARKDCDAANAALRLLPASAPALVVEQALHFANILAIGAAKGGSGSLRAEATEFFKRTIARGYFALNKVVQRYDGPQL